jgi:hypothetical protein
MPGILIPICLDKNDKVPGNRLLLQYPISADTGKTTELLALQVF